MVADRCVPLDAGRARPHDDRTVDAFHEAGLALHLALAGASLPESVALITGAIAAIDRAIIAVRRRVFEEQSTTPMPTVDIDDSPGMSALVVPEVSDRDRVGPVTLGRVPAGRRIAG